MEFHHFIAWAIFLAFVLAMLAVDLFVLHRKPHAIQFKEALIGALIPISTAFLFMGVLYFAYNAHVLDMGNLMFLTGDPTQAKHDPKFMNADAGIIFTPDLQAAAPALPAPVREAMMATPQWQWVKDKPFVSELRAIDPMTGKTKWAVPALGWQDRHGVLATGTGLVFHGDVGGRLFARSSDTGKALWHADSGTSIMAAPMTYKVNGVQYVAVQAGWKRARNTCLAADTVSLLAAVVLYIFAAGVVKGFAFALGLSTLIDLAIFFWFTHPMVTLLARYRFFNSGHKLSGLSAETLGVDRVATAGGRA